MDKIIEKQKCKYCGKVCDQEIERELMRDYSIFTYTTCTNCKRTTTIKF